MNVVSAVHQSSPDNETSQSELGQCVSRTVCRYLNDIGDTPCLDKGLYALVLCEVEASMLRNVLDWHNGNQSRAAETLGINRATLRKKLKVYNLV